MINILFYKILIYIMLATIVYLFLKFFPTLKLSTTNNLLLTLFIVLFCFIFDKLLQLIRKDVSENYDNNNSSSCNTCKIQKSSSCNTCKIEKFDDKNNDTIKTDTIKTDINKTDTNKTDTKINTNKTDTKIVNNNKKCRLVCDSDLDIIDKSNIDKSNNNNNTKDSKYSDQKKSENNENNNFDGMFHEDVAFNKYSNAKVQQYDLNREKRENDYVSDTKKNIEERAKTLDPYEMPYQKGGEKTGRNITLDNRRRIEGELDDEMPYTDYNHLPVASGYKSHDYEYGYSFLPPEKWYNQPPRAPVCVTEKRCPIIPVYTQGSPVDVKEFHSSRRITQPDLINTEYIQDKLNSGR